MVEIRSYVLVLVGESNIRERRTIFGISHLQSLCFYIRVNLSLNSSVTPVLSKMQTSKTSQLCAQNCFLIWYFAGLCALPNFKLSQIFKSSAQPSFKKQLTYILNLCPSNLETQSSKLKIGCTLFLELPLISKFANYNVLPNLAMPQNFKPRSHSSLKLRSLQDFALPYQKLKPQRLVNFVLGIAFGLRFCRLVRPTQLQAFKILTKFQFQCTSKVEEITPVKINSLRLKS